VSQRRSLRNAAGEEQARTQACFNFTLKEAGEHILLTAHDYVEEDDTVDTIVEKSYIGSSIKAGMSMGMSMEAVRDILNIETE
jgi:hypothetical protein